MRTLLGAAAFGAALTAQAQPVPFTGAAYTQDFQSMTATNLTPAGISATTMLEVSAQNGGGSVTGWYVYHQNSGTPRWGRTNGAASTGSFFVMFDGQPTPKRALGSLASGSVATALGVVLQNTSGSTINNVSITYSAYINRNPSTTVNSFPMSYRVSAAGVLAGSGTGDGTFNDAAGSWISSTGFNTPTTGTGAPNATQAAISPLFLIGGAPITADLTGLGWDNGEYLYIRWEDTDEGGSDATAGIGEFSIVATSTPTVLTDLTGFTADFGNVNVGSSSASSTFSVSGNNLTANLEVLAPAGFEVSLDGSTWNVNPVVLTPSGGNVAATPIYVRFSPGAAGPFAADVACSSTGATTQNVAVQGNGIAVAAPTKLVMTPVNGGNPVVDNLPFSVTVEARDDDDNLQNVSQNTTVQLSVDQGFGALGGTLTGTILSGTNSVTFTNLTYSPFDFGVVLRAQATAGDALADAFSDPFDVLGPAQDLSFANVAPSGLTGQAIGAFQVDALRFDATVATEYAGAITLSLLSGPGNLLGTLTQNAINGSATFNDISFDAPGQYILSASAVGLNGSNSPAIVITDVPAMIELILPQYAVNGATSGVRLPYVCRLELSNLVPNATYRYIVGASTNPSLGLSTAAGNMYAINNAADAFGHVAGHTASKGMNGQLLTGDEFAPSGSRFAELTTDANGAYTGWFSMVPTGNAVFDNGNDVYFYVQLNNGFGGLTITNSVRTTNTIRMIIPTSTARAAYGSSSAAAENMVFLYDNEAGTGRPIWGSWAESDGIDQTYSTWHDGNVDGQAGRWAAYLPTTLPNGIRRIEQRSTATGDLVDCPGLSPNGIWSGAGSTVNPSAGTTPIAFTTGDANFDAPTTWYADADGDGLGDPNDTQLACAQPEDHVAVAGDACPLVSGTVGSPCNDGDDDTINDQIQGDCTCAGQNVDCEGTPNGPALPGSPCDDEDPATGNDTWDNACNCVGQLIDCENVVGGPALPGTPCDDGDGATGNDTWDANCVCVGLALDCEGVPGGPAIPGSACNDGNPGTFNDVWDNGCVCAGTPVSYGVGNVVVLQAGNGTGSLTNTGNPIVLREFTPTGTSTFDLPIPSSGADPLVVSGTATSEGLLSRSSDRRELVFAGYAQTLPGASNLPGTTAATVGRAVGTVSASAAYAREAVSSSFFSGGNPRSAGGDGTGYWGAGSNTGVVYYGPGAPAIVSTTLTNNRSTEVYGGQLYFSTGSGATRGIWAVGTGLPTGTGTTSTNVINTGGTSSPYEFVFNAGGTTCYIADDRAVASGGGIQRWDLVGGVWTLSYTLGTGGTSGARGVEVDFSGVVPIVYGITADGGGRLIRIDDTGAGSSAVTLATAPANTAFRGVALAPQDCDPPVVNVTTNSPICAGDALTLTANATGVGTLSYFWQGTGTLVPVDPASPNVSFLGAATGTYYATVSSGCGSTTVPVEVVVNAPPTLSAAITPASCPGQSDGAIDLTVTGGTGSPTFDWVSTIPCSFAAQCPGSIGICQMGVCGGMNLTEDLSGLPAASYTVTVTMGGCTVTETFTVGYLNLDTDGDLIPDCVDSCPTTPGQIGSACDDSNPNTVLDVLDGSCTCAGQACTTDLDLIWQPDGVSSITWELRQQGTDILVQAGGGIYPETPAYSEATCLPDGCFYLVVTDDAGDGIAGGGYQLKINSGARIIDNLTDAFGSGGFTTGYTSQVANGEGFCLPLGSDRLIFTSCDRVDWKTSPCGGEFVVANTNAAVSAQYGVSNANSGYQMWWFDPNGGYSFKRFQSHNTSNGLPASATRACHFQLNSWSGNQLQEGVVYNVKVRGRIAGNYLPWGPACRLTVNNAAAQCPRTKLMDIPGNQYLSCGQTRPVGTSQASLVHARPVRRMNANCNWVSANRYQFRFRLPSENFELVKTSALGKYFVNTNGLQCDKTYEVDVRASFDGGATWCHSSNPWGDVCLLTTTCSNALAEEGTGTGTAAGTLRMYPNPNQGDQLMLGLSAVAEGVQTVSIDIFDLFGKRVAARTIPVQDGFVNSVLELNGELANGMYVVSITAGTDSYTERLVIQK
ncbi:MAG: T9SS type A sorting domain-containing protein [Flavobacteriales bacterium]|nr:MAG: T9SS type A sorting domain-containing protein [Flavobacteriales bacterium]